MSDTATGDDTDKKTSWYNPANLFDGIAFMFDSDKEVEDKTNLQGAFIWTALGFYILGQSLGTWRTSQKGTTDGRFHLGPVYVW